MTDKTDTELVCLAQKGDKEAFYAIAKLRNGQTVKELDARPSDALALAVRTGSPVFVAPEVWERASPPVSDLPGQPLAFGEGVSLIVNDIQNRQSARQKKRAVK